MSEVKRFITRYSRDYQGNLQEDPNGSWVLAADAAIRDKKLMDKIAALQDRLNAADQRIDDQAGLLRRCVMAVREQHCDPDEAEFDLTAELMADIDAQLSASTEPEQDDDWHMNPCKLGHRDVGASGGVAACNQCDEKIEAATTQQAFERWNATHPASESAESQ